jgi:hypothetical protein
LACEAGVAGGDGGGVEVERVVGAWLRGWWSGEWECEVGVTKCVSE